MGEVHMKLIDEEEHAALVRDRELLIATSAEVARLSDELKASRQFADVECAARMQAQADVARLREALRRAATWGLCPPSTAMAREIQDEYVADSAAIRAALDEPASDSKDGP